ncbi:hypothetical protein GUJ93_ZPchr0009g813 [Zizania palustris]|uniref:Uncharacterized protein n=1 Tax=Zizania palustris TaxID=103762 RepID=A0A8J5RGD6_ZIZPA|nr:hypothetical protein GUJ93_ZPchr0009g813 [Zizania palustris]
MFFVLAITMASGVLLALPGSALPRPFEGQVGVSPAKNNIYGKLEILDCQFHAIVMNLAGIKGLYEEKVNKICEAAEKLVV